MERIWLPRLTTAIGWHHSNAAYDGLESQYKQEALFIGNLWAINLINGTNSMIAIDHSLHRKEVSIQRK